MAASLRIPIRQPTQSQIDLLVDNGNNPPLALASATAVFAELPWIYFESDGQPLTARYGDELLERPRYDLEAVLGSIADDTRAAVWGAERELEPTRAGVPIAPLPTIGASIDTAQFRYAREVPQGGDGLMALRLDAPALVNSAGPRGRFADVRIVDDEERQVPYLLERQDEPLSIDVSIMSVDDAEHPHPAQLGESLYRVSMPLPNLPPSQLVLSTSGRVFRRQVTLEMVVPPDERRREPRVRSLHTTEWSHANRETLPPELSLPVPSVADTEVFVRVQEGDNLPLPLAGARLLLPSYRLRFFREADANLQLLYGADDLGLPSYDLTLLAPQLLGAVAEEVEAGAQRATGTMPVRPRPLVSPVLFWSSLVLAVVVLLGIIGRLLIKETSDGPTE